jgi:biotin carboxyl carrier protein
MKKFNFTIQGNEYSVNILSTVNSTIELELNGTKYEVHVDKKIDTPKTPQLVRAKSQPSTESDKVTAKTSSPSERKGSGTIKAPLPGTILEVFAKEGDYIKTGTKLLVWEAMKMENTLSADREGTIKSVKVKAGDSILEGDILIEIE